MPVLTIKTACRTAMTCAVDRSIQTRQADGAARPVTPRGAADAKRERWMKRVAAVSLVTALLLGLAVPIGASAHLTMDRAFDGTLLYAKRNCYRDSWCKQ